jgi:hypothetical protein
MVTLRPAATSKTRLELLPRTVSFLAPRPSISRLCLISSSPWVTWMVSPMSALAKVIVSPAPAEAITERNVPLEPSSAALVTVSMLGTARSSRASRRGRKRPRRRHG